MYLIGMNPRALPAIVVVLALAVRLHAELSQSDVAKIRRVNDGYADGWRRNDRAAIMGLFRSDAVIIPSGLKPIQGLEAIAHFWFPENGGKTTVTKFDHTTDEIGGSPDCAFVRGTFAFDFTYEADGKSDHLSNAGNYLMLLRRDTVGEWKITHRMWADRRR